MFNADILMKPMDSIPGGLQARLMFGPELELSIVQHDGSYGGDKGLYEIGVFKNNDMVEMPGITEPGDSVKGFLTEDEVGAIITKMMSITGSDPVEV